MVADTTTRRVVEEVEESVEEVAEIVEVSSRENTGESVGENTGEIVEVESRDSTEEQTDENIENTDENIEEQTDENTDEGTDEGTVLAGVMTWGASVSGGSAFVGFSGARSLGGPDRVGGFEMRFLDGVVVRSRTHLYALAQMAGSVGAGPAAGLVDPVILTMTTDVDLSGGFTVEVDGCVLGSVDAVNPFGGCGQVPVLDVGRAVRDVADR